MALSPLDTVAVFVVMVVGAAVGTLAGLWIAAVALAWWARR